MAITSTDILFKLSEPGASSGNYSPQADPNASLGRYMSDTEITDATLNNLFDNISGDENAAEDVEYRCFFIHNSHSSLTLLTPKVWIYSEVAGGADATIGLDPSGVTDAGYALDQAVYVATESDAPSGVAFSYPTVKASGLSPADIGPDQCLAIWVKRTATNSSAKDNDGVTIRIEGDTQE